MNDDEKFDEWLPTAARDYNRPPAPGAVPRDAMWAAIESAVPEAPSVAAPAITPVIPLAPRRRSLAMWQAAAAVLILAAGIGIGSQWRAATADVQPLSSPASPANSPQVASVDPVDRLDTSASPTADRSSADNESPRAGLAAPSESYDLVATQHLSRAEALLTSFRSQERTSTGSAMDRWARDLLADTRLLMDSPAASDARRRQLLEDLELVLAQIVQLPAESSADRALVQRSIERGAVLTRLRSSIPAGFVGSGT